MGMPRSTDMLTHQRTDWHDEAPFMKTHCRPVLADPSWLQRDSETPQMEDTPLSSHQERADDPALNGWNVTLRHLAPGASAGNFDHN